MTNESWKKADEFLKSHDSAVISTLSPGNMLESAYLFYVCDDDFNLYFMTKRTTQKYKNIIANKEIAFVITDEASLITAQGRGSATEIVDATEIQKIFSMLLKVVVRRMHDWPPPIAKLGESDAAYIRIEPMSLRLGDFAKRKDLTEAEGCFDQII